MSKDLLFFSGFIAGAVFSSILINFNFLNYLTNFDTTIAASLAGWVAVKNFKFQSLHKKRVAVIEEAYEKLVITHDAFNTVMHPVQSGNTSNEVKIERERKLIEDANAFFNFYKRKKIFFAPEMAHDLDIINAKYQELWGNWKFMVDFPNTPLDQKHVEWMKIWKSLDKDGEVSTMKYVLEKKFRSILDIK